MNYGKHHSFWALLLRAELTFYWYFGLSFVVYLALFYLAPLSWLIEALQYLLPIMSVGAALFAFNLVTAWRKYNK